MDRQIAWPERQQNRPEALIQSNGWPRVGLKSILGLMLIMSAGSVHARELDITFGSRAVDEPSLLMVSSTETLSTVAFHLTQPLKGRDAFHWQLGYEYYSTNNSTNPESVYAEELDCGSYFDNECQPYYTSPVVGTLRVHGLEGGVRWEGKGLSWFRPYVGLKARAQVGLLSFSDDSTGWTKPDPENYETEVLYTLTEAQDIGAAFGGELTVGGTIWVNAPVGKRRPTGTSAPAASPVVPAVAPAVIPAAAPVMIPAAAPAAAPAAVATEGNPAAAPVAPVPAEGTMASGEGTPAPAMAPIPAPTVAPVAVVEPPAVTAPEPPAAPAPMPPFLVGLSLEAGYVLMSPLTFSTSGDLNLSGLSLNGSLAFKF